MVNANVKDEAQKSAFNPGKDEAQLNSLNAMKEEEEEDDDDEYEYEYKEEEEEEEEEKEEEEEEEPAEEKVKKENAVKEDGKNCCEPESEEKLGENLKKDKRSSSRNRKKSDSGTLAVNVDKPESSNRKKASKRVASMGMVFMCSSKTKTDCFRYKILGLPESKKDQVLKIYRGMRLFLFDVDFRLMYGIFKAAGPGGYNIEPKAFKSEFPSQVRFTVLDDCLPLAEEKFKSVLKENYYSRNKFEGLLKSGQVKKLCKLFVGRSKSRRTRTIETRRHESDRRMSRAQEKRKRRARDEERRPHSPAREKRRYTAYDHPPVLYDREPPVPRYHRPQPAAMRSPVRLYTYERDIPSYVRDRVPEPHTYRVFDRERDPYLAYSREPPLYRDAVYAVPPPDYHLVSRVYHHPSAVPTSEYRRVPNYREVEIAGDYRAAAPDYRSLTHYKY